MVLIVFIFVGEKLKELRVPGLESNEMVTDLHVTDSELYVSRLSEVYHYRITRDQ